MLPVKAPKPKDWTDKDRWICTLRWLEATAHSVYNGCDPDYKGIDLGEKGDPCFGCPAGERCPAFCDETHWKRYTEFYAFENFKIVEQFAGIQMTGIDAILRQICDANSLGVKCYEEKS